jgi:hypothetical protein
VILALFVSCRDRVDANDEHHDEASPWSSIEGTLEYDYTVSGSVVCDATVSFTGTPYAGDCKDCDFAFEIEPVLERDEGTIACPWNPILTLYAPGSFWIDPTVVGFTDHNNGIPDVLILGATTEWYGTTLGELEDGYLGSVSLDGNELAWTIDAALGYKPLTGIRYSPSTPCAPDYFYPYDAHGPYAAGNTTYGELGCSSEVVDVFEFEGQAGGVVKLTADTTSDDLAPVMLLWVYGPESCVERAAFGNFECSKGDELPCPALSIDTEPGRYVAVLSALGCDGDGDGPGGYRLDLDASWDPKLAQIHDDLYNYGPASFRIDASATLTE